MRTLAAVRFSTDRTRVIVCARTALPDDGARPLALAGCHSPDVGRSSGIAKEESHISPFGSTTGGPAARTLRTATRASGRTARLGASPVARVAAVGALALALVVVALVIFNSGSSYTLRANFQNASGLVTGDNVLIGPAAVGTVTLHQPDAQRRRRRWGCRSTRRRPRCTRGRSPGSTRIRCPASPASTSSWSPARAAGAADRQRRADRRLPHVLGGQHRPAVRHLRPAHPRRSAERHPGRGGRDPGQGRWRPTGR